MPLLRPCAALLLVLATACTHSPQPHARALAHNDLCAEQLTQGELVKAEANCDLGLEYAPRYGNLWVNKGLIALEDGRKADAKAHFIKAIRYNQEQLQAYQNLGTLYFEEGDFEKAAHSFERALKVDPAYNEARFNLGLAYLRLGSKEPRYRARARSEFHKMLAVNPEVADAHHALGELAYLEGNPEAAAASFEKAVQLAPSHAVAWHDLGVVLMELKRPGEAAEAFAACVAHEAANARCTSGLEAAKRTAVRDAE
ncbi:MAG TPA: tetratricopeptide repeat protein [Aggregicoccus sp.]|nr:tetratricopeptide repeat protein [Aggregicoccus sp.]